MFIRKHIDKTDEIESHRTADTGSQTDSLSWKSDPEVWKEFRKGDERAFIYIYRSHSEAMFNYGCQLTIQKDFVRDCIQDLFCELMDENRNLGEVLSIKGYLFKCIKRKILQGLKRKSNPETIDINHSGFQVSIKPELIEITNTFDDDVFDTLQKAINNLPVQQREVILLHFYEGLSYKEISEIIGIKVKSVRMQAYRAVRSLRNDLNSSPYKFVVAFLLSIS